MKIAAIIIGLFVVGLSYLSYRGWIDVRWVETKNAAKGALTNVKWSWGIDEPVFVEGKFNVKRAKRN